MPRSKKKQSDPENQDMLELGQKQRAGRLLSEYLRAIGTETTEVILDDSPSPGVPRIVSKAEALARWLWRKALPHKDDKGNLMAPNLEVVKIVLDRVEGRPGAVVTDSSKGRESVPDKISRLGVERLNRM